MKKYIFLKAILTGCCFVFLTACGMTQTELQPEETKKVSFANRIGMAQPYSTITIPEKTPFGENLMYQIGAEYPSALGVICKKALILDGSNRGFIVCQEKNKKDAQVNWELVPVLK